MNPLHFVRSPVGLSISTLEMTIVAVDFARDQSGTAPIPRPSHRLAGGFIHSEEIVAIHAHAGHAEPAGAIREVVAGGRIVAGSGVGVTIVFDDEDTRQTPDCSEVETLERGPLIRSSVTDKAHSNSTSAKFLSRQCGSTSQRRTAAHDPVGAQHSLAEISNVHRATLARTESILLAVNLSHHPIHVTPFGNAVTMATMSAGELVAVVEVHANACGNRFLSRIEMDEARNIAGCKLQMNPFLEFPDHLHGPIRFEQVGVAELHSTPSELSTLPRHGRLILRRLSHARTSLRPKTATASGPCRFQAPSHHRGHMVFPRPEPEERDKLPCGIAPVPARSRSVRDRA